MRPNFLALWLTLSCLPGFVFAEEAGIRVYGRLNSAVEYVRGSEKDKTGVRLANYRSVLGFTGNENLSNGWKAVWQIEGAVSLDTGSGGIASRDSRVGLMTPYGVLFVGNWSTPYTSSTQSLDPFYISTAGYMSIIGNGSAPSSDNVIDTTSFDRRQRNSLHYWSNERRGLSVRAAYGLSEEKSARSSPSLTSLAMIYERDGLYLTAAHEIHREYHGSGLNDSATKVGIGYRLSATRVTAVVEYLHYETQSGALRRYAVFLSATHQFGSHGFRASLAYAPRGTGPSAEQRASLRSGMRTGATQHSLGYEYKMSAGTILLSYLTHLTNQTDAEHEFGSNGIDTNPGESQTAFSLGIRHSF